MSEYVRPDSQPGTGTNQSARVTECSTCQGDRFVTVALRSPHNPNVKDRFYEEVAPCPDCNPIDVSYFRHDGTKFRGMDPAAVRQAIKQ